MNSHSFGGQTANQAATPSQGMGAGDWATILSSAFQGLGSLSQPVSGIKSKEVKRRLFADLLSQALLGGNKIRNTELNSNQYLSNERAKNLRNQAGEVASAFRSGR